MPTALSTTKRKFHKILDSISNASSTSLATYPNQYNGSTATLPTTMDPPSKKPRVARPTSAYARTNEQSITAAIASASRDATAALSQTPSSATLSEERKAPPNFAPWDRGQFLQRLRTYRHVDKWTGKPDGVNEVEWAKRGWSCVGKDRVGCVGGCSKEVVIKLESAREDREMQEDEQPVREEDYEEEDEEYDDWREKAREELVEKYAEMIAKSHDGGCLWRRRGCDDTIHRLPLAHQETAIDGLRQRYLSLTAIASDLPPVLSVPEPFDVERIFEQTVPFLKPTILNQASEPTAIHSPNASATENSATPPHNKSALILALFGWQAEEEHISGLATCTACFRRLGLWLFKNSADADSQSSMDRLDVVGEHRDYCPWINALSQNGASTRRSSLEGLAGWEVLLRAVQVRAIQRREENGDLARENATANDAASDVGSVVASTTLEDRASRDEKDKERWAKLKRLKQVFHVRSEKAKETKSARTGNNAG